MEHFALNLQLLQWLYAGTVVPSHWQLALSGFIAKDLISFFPLVLIYQCLRYRDRRALVIVIFIAVLLASSISFLIGHLYPTARPFVDGVVTNYIKHAADYSFPSDHMTFACTVAFGFIFGRIYKLGFFLLLLAFAIGLSRVYLGIHYPLDIVGGFILGLLSAFICIKGLLIHFQRALL